MKYEIVIILLFFQFTSFRLLSQTDSIEKSKSITTVLDLHGKGLTTMPPYAYKYIEIRHPVGMKEARAL